MTSNTTVVPLRQPETIDDPLTAILRSGARRLLAQAVEAEAEAFLAAMKGAPLPDGLAYEAAALAEPLSVAVRALRKGRLALGERVAIVGGGTIGLLCLQVARAAGAGLVADSDPASEYAETLHKARALVRAAEEAWRFA